MFVPGGRRGEEVRGAEFAGGRSGTYRKVVDLRGVCVGLDTRVDGPATGCESRGSGSDISFAFSDKFEDGEGGMLVSEGALID